MAPKNGSLRAWQVSECLTSTRVNDALSRPPTLNPLNIAFKLTSRKFHQSKIIIPILSPKVSLIFRPLLKTHIDTAI